ncbi:SDR family NAD(P)-dependent oxidoreductase [Mangrovibacter plantisponsor]|uniref:NAD(P)-dependent dehydrogenase (Short-subunit alcohol dehydrogenase family) n=1 Tax=Mangrovibacter plantisponsor TaxID=451513 RepID=A0A317Q513_9ENTR|nr:SDR family NAD(P)-dependent oxidoreductase [Mangrovibacter plantisponsor]PWW11674.1 NAD(P)-dependent dehydrogenase (short-subunit alcohol dehydrogenase family) [Mangrovibacter plantisponsor]
MNFQNKVAVITGSTAGIGEAVAEQLHKHGAKVVIVSRASEQAKQKAKLLSSQGQEAMGIGCDVSQPEQVRKMIDDIIKYFGRLDYAVNNAGITGEHGKNITEQTVENWDKVIATSLSGVFYCLKYEIDQMMKFGGSIVNLSAVNGLVGIPGLAPYTAAKHGIIGLTQTAALEYACQGIRINAVAPGYVHTPRMNEFPEKIIRSFVNSHPMKRMATMQEIADFILFLLSDNSAFCTGGIYPIDGGYLAE